PPKVSAPLSIFALAVFIIYNIINYMNRKILLIDDVVSILTVFSYSLKQAGYDVYTADNCTDGYKLVTEILPDLIIIDNKMPTGISGWETTKTIKSNPITRHIPIVGFTAYTGKNEIANGMRSGLDEIVLKPVYIDELLTVIRKYVR
ncbi:MAG TPA: hypothetical protein DHV24_12510, partial [Candidatus Margulisbacteria bacterium]|nr:hypothetical protein [Candidatus Margulisiibacteriota bacterium]